jgi:hypothetical protein
MKGSITDLELRRFDRLRDQVDQLRQQSAVLDELGWSGREFTKARESQTAQALFRLGLRGQVLAGGSHARRLWGALSDA